MLEQQVQDREAKIKTLELGYERRLDQLKKSLE